ncbi:MAG: tetratricopeptide repeat protein [Myxococcaceae bacterium]
MGDASKPKKKKKKAGSKPRDTTPANTLPFEIEAGRIEESLAKMKDQIVYWAKKGRYTKVRFKFRGKQVLPDMPLAAVAAAQGLTFWWAGLLRTLVFSMAGGTVLSMELVNDSEKKVALGKEQLLAGELDKAIAIFKDARDMDIDNANVHLNLGVALKLKGELLAARASLERAQKLDPQGPIGAEAERVLGGIPKPAVAG